ncbi:MAG: DEAD/DEAH box helicase, partial [Candidatus Gastranaerophilales bacterium]|nr:DEAD/DEAH box helicase [Candidatus Gastranaerophilales bacterium]
KNYVSKKSSKYIFPVMDIFSLFDLLPANPIFYDRKDFKSKLFSIYEAVETELDSILVKEELPPLRNTGFYLYYSNENILKAFISPANSFLYYLKSKGSRIRFSNERLTIPVWDETEQKFILKEKEGVTTLAENVFDYFLYLTLNEDNGEISPSSKFLSETAYLAVALVKALSFVPEVIMQDKVNFTVRYIPLADKSSIVEAINYHQSLMPVNVVFKEKGNKVLSNQASYDILSIFLTHIIHKLTFLKSSKIKKGDVTSIFTKPQLFNAISPEGKNIAASISYWLDALSAKNKDIRPIIKVESYKDRPENSFAIYIDIINYKNNDIIPLFKLFESDKKQVIADISGQLMIASNYMPLLKDILDSKGLISPIIDLKEILELVSSISVILNGLGIEVVIPKELKNLFSPRISLKARMKDSNNIDINSFFDSDNKAQTTTQKLFDFSYEIALGDKTVSKEEFLELVKAADGIVKYKDQYVLLKPEEINSILEKLNKPVPEMLSSMELFHSAISGFYNDMDFNPDHAFKRAIEELVKVEEITIPAGLAGVLRPYQERGFRWLYSNKMRGFGSCIADDMGLGKTIQVISLILKLKEEGKLKKPALVICPTTLVGNWHKECAKFAPSLNVYIYHGIDRSLELDGIDVAITTYGLLRNDVDEFKNKDWDIIIIDEAQNIKNPDAAQSIAVKSIKTGTYIAMTGTPVENRLSELWSIFDFTNKGYLGNISSFQKNYAMPIEKHRDAERIEKLKLVTEPFVLRRLKSDKSIISDLPEKIVFDEYCYLTKEQAALYEKVLENSFKTIEDKTGIHRKGQIFKLITSLKQICNHPTQYTKLDKLSKDLSGKAEKTFSIIDQIFEQNEKAVIFTQYKEMGDLLVRMIKDELKMDVPFFHGSVTRTKRDQLVENFQSDENIKLMIISLKAGGTGLNLTAATNVIHYDLWWNPAVEDQATDRTYRIGQTRNVIVHRLITLGTFEEKIDEMLKSKKELADLTVSSGEKLITELSNNELKEIFSLARF